MQKGAIHLGLACQEAKSRSRSFWQYKVSEGSLRNKFHQETMRLKTAFIKRKPIGPEVLIHP